MAIKRRASPDEVGDATHHARQVSFHTIHVGCWRQDCGQFAEGDGLATKIAKPAKIAKAFLGLFFVVFAIIVIGPSARTITTKYQFDPRDPRLVKNQRDPRPMSARVCRQY